MDALHKLSAVFLKKAAAASTTVGPQPIPASDASPAQLYADQGGHAPSGALPAKPPNSRVQLRLQALRDLSNKADIWQEQNAKVPIQIKNDQSKAAGTATQHTHIHQLHKQAVQPPPAPVQPVTGPAGQFQDAPVSVADPLAVSILKSNSSRHRTMYSAANMFKRSKTSAALRPTLIMPASVVTGSVQPSTAAERHPVHTMPLTGPTSIRADARSLSLQPTKTAGLHHQSSSGKPGILPDEGTFPTAGTHPCTSAYKRSSHTAHLGQAFAGSQAVEDHAPLSAMGCLPASDPPAKDQVTAEQCATGARAKIAQLIQQAFDFPLADTHVRGQSPNMATNHASAATYDAKPSAKRNEQYPNQQEVQDGGESVNLAPDSRPQNHSPQQPTLCLLQTAYQYAASQASHDAEEEPAPLASGRFQGTRPAASLTHTNLLLHTHTAPKSRAGRSSSYERVRAWLQAMRKAPVSSRQRNSGAKAATSLSLSKLSDQLPSTRDLSLLDELEAVRCSSPTAQRLAYTEHPDLPVACSVANTVEEQQGWQQQSCMQKEVLQQQCRHALDLAARMPRADSLYDDLIVDLSDCDQGDDSLLGLGVGPASVAPAHQNANNHDVLMRHTISEQGWRGHIHCDLPKHSGFARCAQPTLEAEADLLLSDVKLAQHTRVCDWFRSPQGWSQKAEAHLDHELGGVSWESPAHKHDTFLESFADGEEAGLHNGTFSDGGFQALPGPAARPLDQASPSSLVFQPTDNGTLFVDGPFQPGYACSLYGQEEMPFLRSSRLSAGNLGMSSAKQLEDAVLHDLNAGMSSTWTDIVGSCQGKKRSHDIFENAAIETLFSNLT